MKYGPEITKEICGYLRDGNNRGDACVLSNISYETFTVWMQKPEFSEAIKRAEIECKNRNIKIIQKAAKKTWTAAAWWLERKFQNEFAIKQRVSFTDESESRERPSIDVLLSTIAVLRKEIDGLRTGTEVAGRK